MIIYNNYGHNFTCSRNVTCFPISWKQEKALFQIKPELEEATRELYTTLLPRTIWLWST
jgi:hypothetical protein